MLDIQGKLCSNDMIKNYLLPHIGKKVNIKYNLGRNKFESFNAEILSVYNCLFLVKLDNNTIKSFSFSDIITKKIIFT
ncbi:MAG: Veg family protein [Bacilli bacterium]|nr:Veg family protein [Bacilli bacterium]